MFHYVNSMTKAAEFSQTQSAIIFIVVIYGGWGVAWKFVHYEFLFRKWNLKEKKHFYTETQINYHFVFQTHGFPP